MRMDLCHVGDVRQWDLTPGDQVVPSARLHVPQIALPRDTEPKNLHGDVEGSPYSRNPGEIGLEAIEARAREEREGRVRTHAGRGRSTTDDPPKDPTPDPKDPTPDPKDPTPDPARASEKK